ncbi:MAG: pyruvate synthase subunit beta [Candidatus Aenigmatarchaeota archaeon]|nr:MAG: pyruvate synthase subunit beta [Candidatus Aenigmarchaeota archaeon]
MAELISQGQTTCSGCGMIIAVRLVSKACPDKVIVSCGTSCLEVTTSAYPLTAWNVPWIHTAFETTSSTASGIEAAVKKLGKDWKVLAIAGDGGTFDIGFQALSGMLERCHKVTQVCVDNEAYMNTGIQRSGATPFGAWTTTSPPGKKSVGTPQTKKPLVEIIAAHKIPYAVTASIAYPTDLINKVKKAFEKQPSLVHIQCPCPPGWKFSESDTISVAKLAVETGSWILYEIEDGKVKINLRPKRKPVKEYLKTQGRFKHLKEEHIQEIQKHIDSEWERFEKLEKCERIF